MFNIETIKIGDKVSIGKHKPMAYGVVRAVFIESSHVAYKVEVTSWIEKRKNSPSTVVVKHHFIKRDSNDPDDVMKTIL